MCTTGHPSGLSPGEAKLILVINIFFPGIGTMISACLSPHCSCDTIMVGLLQLLLAVTIVGWVWAIWWSAKLVGTTSHGARTTHGESKA